MRPGSLLMLLGAIVLVAASAFAFGGAPEEIAGPAVVAWGIMAAGAAMIVTGYAQRRPVPLARRPVPASERLADPLPADAPPADTARIDMARIDAMVRCMGFIAAADGAIDDAERAMFADIVERVIGRPLAAADMRVLLDRAGEQIFDPVVFVRDRAAILDAPFRRQILKAGCFIAMADGALADTEAVRLRSLAVALKIPAAEYDAVVAGMPASGAVGAMAAHGPV